MSIVDVVIPVYMPDKKFARLLAMLSRQTHRVNRIIVMNTEKSYWNETGYDDMPNMEIHHITREQFDHGGTRNAAIESSDADIVVCMTDDAVPADNYLIEKLVNGFSKKGPGKEEAAVVYARQLPDKNCRYIERYTRSFNYPDHGMIKTKNDIKNMGIKTYFASNVCCAYRRDIYIKTGGFTKKTIFNEDMIYAAKVINAGYAVVYEAGAKVIHSHNLSGKEQFKRNFDLAVSQVMHPEVFKGLPSEGEGIKLVKNTASYLVRTGHIWLLPQLLWMSGCKFSGYRMGKKYKLLPKALIMKFTMNKMYWR